MVNVKQWSWFIVLISYGYKDSAAIAQSTVDTSNTIVLEKSIVDAENTAPALETVTEGIKEKSAEIIAFLTKADNVKLLISTNMIESTDKAINTEGTKIRRANLSSTVITKSRSDKNKIVASAKTGQAEIIVETTQFGANLSSTASTEYSSDVDGEIAPPHSTADVKKTLAADNTEKMAEYRSDPGSTISTAESSVKPKNTTEVIKFEANVSSTVACTNCSSDVNIKAPQESTIKNIIIEETVNVSYTVPANASSDAGFMNGFNTDSEEIIFDLYLGDDVYTTSRSLQEDTLRGQQEASTERSRAAPAESSMNTTSLVSDKRRQFNLDFQNKLSRLPETGAVQPVTPSLAPIASNKYISLKVSEDYFMPYMGASNGSSKGNWVYSRDTRYIAAPTIHGWSYWSLSIAPERYQRYCTDFYRRLGQVCAYRLDEDMFTYEYRTFSDWCDMEFEGNWKYRFYRSSFSVLHLGQCTDDAEFFPNTWSSQDGFWEKNSAQGIIDAASAADSAVMYVKSKHIDYDYKCKTFYPGFTSTFVQETGACYLFSDFTYQHPSALKFCKERDSHLIYFSGYFEREAVIKAAAEKWPYSKKKYDQFYTGYKQMAWPWDGVGTSNWQLYETGQPVESIGFNPFNKVGRPEDSYEPGPCGVADGWRNMEVYGISCIHWLKVICKRVVPKD